MSNVRRAVVAMGALLLLAACSSGADEQRVAPSPEPTGPTELLPDMSVLPASNVFVDMSTGERVLRFGTTLTNIGVGPLEVRPEADTPCPEGERFFVQDIALDVVDDGMYDAEVDTATESHDGACALFHDDHDHWHIDGSAGYELQEPSGDPVVTTDKVSFCLRDSDPVPGAPVAGAETYGACSRDEVQGISPGWGDLYESDLSGQTLELPDDLADGTYCLVMTADPFDFLREGDEGNNVSTTPVEVTGAEAVVSDSTACAR